MALTAEGMSPADIGALVNGNGNNDGWGGSGAWWIVVLFLFAWMRGGWGGNNGDSSGALTRGELCMDMNFQDLKNAVQGSWQGLCDGFYAMNNSILTGFSNAELSRCNQQAALMTQLYNMSTQVQQCCCNLEQLNAQTNYNIAQQGCDTRNLIQNSTRDVIESTNNGFRAILDKMCQQEIAAKDAQIAAQSQQIFGLQLANSNQGLYNDLVNTLRPTPQPTFNVPNPFAGCGCGGYTGYNNGCGCGY